MNNTDNLNKVLDLSRQQAQQLGNQQVMPEHLLLAIIQLGEGKAVELLKEAGVDLQKTTEVLSSNIRTLFGATEPGLPYFDRTVERIVRIMDLETKAYKANASDTEHLLMAILRERLNKVANYLNDTWQINYEKMEKLFPKPHQMPNPRAGADFSSDLEDDMPNAAKQSMSSEPKSNSKTPALDKFGKDLTLAAEKGLLDPVMGREKEIERVIQILSRRKKNNPILIGEPGVGKSAIVEGLALRIVEHKVSPILFDKRIVTLDIAGMVAGTTYRGQFEERMKSVITELQRNPQIILFIDEIHTIIGAGNASGTLDAANILKPALARGEVQCIGATTISEYRKSVEKDGALERRFQKVMVVPTTADETFAILQRLSDAYGKHHNVHYSDEVLHACVSLTERYISDRAFPDKAIDAMDEVGARAQVNAPELPEEICQIAQQIEDIRSAGHAAKEKEEYTEALALRDQTKELEKKMVDAIDTWQKSRKQQPVEVTIDDVANVVSLMSGVPVQRVAKGENERLAHMAETLQKRVIGQDEAVQSVVRAIQRSRLGLKDPNRPIGTFFFLGPTGVGKTHLAQCLAEEMFGKKDALIRFDMSEYMEKHTTSLLVGAPPGYVAHEEGGKLTEAVRRNPYSIILFDEIEKAHPDIFNVLLQVLDEGRMTDRQGRVVDFKNTIIILTSNVGTRQLKDFGAGIGFQHGGELDPKESKAVLLKAMQKQFPPEFVNRIDQVVTFSPLEKESLYHIIDLELSSLIQRLAQQGLSLSVTDEVKDMLIAQSDNKQYGARPLKRAIQTHVEDALTDLLLLEERHEAIRIVRHDDKVIAEWQKNEN